jgi:hypothetical protein
VTVFALHRGTLHRTVRNKRRSSRQVRGAATSYSQRIRRKIGRPRSALSHIWRSRKPGTPTLILVQPCSYMIQLWMVEGACKLVLCLVCWIGETKTLSRYSSPRSRITHLLERSRNKRKLRMPAFRNPCLRKLRRPLNTSCLQKKPCQKSAERFRPQHINFRRKWYLAIWNSFPFLGRSDDRPCLRISRTSARRFHTALPQLGHLYRQSWIC